MQIIFFGFSLIRIDNLTTYCDKISKGMGWYCFMVEDNLHALDLGPVEDLVIWNNYETQQYVFRNIPTSVDVIEHIYKHQEQDYKDFWDSGTGVELEVHEKESLVEWFANNYKSFCC